MRALAEFIMRGRVQASLVALVGNLVPLISPATVGLVTLRRGLLDGMLVWLWAALPLVVALIISSANDFVVMTSVLGLVVVVIAAEVLKGTVSWQMTMLAVIAACSLAMLALGIVIPESTNRVAGDVQGVMAAMDGQKGTSISPFYMLMAVTAASLGVETVNMTYVLGFMSWLTGLNVIVSLLLARWWQSLLFNPGGFQQEFHGLRFGVAVATVLMAAVVACNLLAPEYRAWGSMLGMPLLLAGMGVAHHAVKFRGMGTVWLVVMYAGLLLFGPLSMVLIAVGFLDSFLNFRARLAKSRD